MTECDAQQRCHLIKLSYIRDIPKLNVRLCVKQGLFIALLRPRCLTSKNDIGQQPQCLFQNVKDMLSIFSGFDCQKMELHAQYMFQSI